MASLKQLKDKIKTFNDFTKVVNIQKIAVMKEIGEIKKVIDQSFYRKIIFNNYLIDIQKKHKLFDTSIFNSEKAKIPNKRNMHFVLGNPKSDKLGEYGNKLLAEHIKNNYSIKEDLFVAIGETLSEHLMSQGINVVKTVPLGSDLASSIIYQRISWQLYKGYTDLMFNKANFLYLSLTTKNVEEKNIFPFSDKKQEIDSDNFNSLGETFNIINKVKLSKVVWRKDVSAVAERIFMLAIEMTVYKTIVEYRLSLKTRELQTLDDKEKNIKDEIQKVKLKMQTVRKEGITNELLTSAVAFSVVGTGSSNYEEEEGIK